MIEIERPVVAEPTTPIKPSEALRLGRLSRPRRFEGDFYDGEDGACAVGAMMSGGLYWYRSAPDGLECPLGCFTWLDIEAKRDALVHLNDDHHWSDDQIVTWLEGLGL